MRGFGWLLRRTRPDEELSEREQALWQVRLAEKARRFEDMASAVVFLVHCATRPGDEQHKYLSPNPHQSPDLKQDETGAKPQQQKQHRPHDVQPHALLTREERNLFAVAFKSVADRRRTALRGLELLRARLLREALATKTESTDRALLARLDQLERMQLEVSLELRSLCGGVIVRSSPTVLFSTRLSSWRCSHGMAWHGEPATGGSE